MRSYIFTEHERRALHRWLEYGDESQTLRDLFTKIRVNMTPIREDLELFNRVGRRLQKEHRWHGRINLKKIRAQRWR